LRKKLSAKGTRSAKRLLKKISGAEQRFSREINHIIAKELSERSEVKTYVIEDLSGIRNKSRGRKMNKILSSWAFKQFESFLTYKCTAKGISVEKVDARYTSQRCSCCGTIRKENRLRGRYSCNRCSFTKHADINAAINIRDRWISKSSRSLNCEQDAVNHPHGNSVVLDVGSSAEFQGHGLVP
jgi:IS605 OrfB family transposase